MPATRQQLLVDLEAERTWAPDLRPPGIWDRLRLSRRMLRRLNPVWWYRRAHAAITLGMLCGPYDNPDYQQITFVMDGHDIGRLVFQVCHVCRTGHVANISVDEPYQDRGIASRGLAALRAAQPTTGGLPVASVATLVRSGNSPAGARGPATAPPGCVNTSAGTRHDGTAAASRRRGRAV
jgi:hypothetical protein